MREAPRFRPGGWESLESRVLPSRLGVTPLPPSMVPVDRLDPYAVVRHAQDLQQARSGSAQVVFLGDSIIDFWGDPSRLLTGSAVWDQRIAPLGAANFGVMADTTQTLLWRVTHGELAGRPRVIVLQVGTNNISTGSTPAETAAGIATVVGAIRAQSPSSQILLVGLFPRGQGLSDRLTQEILQVNAMIAGLHDGVHVHYLDMTATFLNPDGSLNRSLLPDGLHPSPQGYEAWASAVLGPIDMMLGRLDQASADVTGQPFGPTQMAAATAPSAAASTPVHANITILNANLSQPLILILPTPSADSSGISDGITQLGQPAHKKHTAGG